MQFNDNDMVIENQSKPFATLEMICGIKVIERKFKISFKNDTRTITHYQLENWHLGAPSDQEESLLHLVKLVYKNWSQKEYCTLTGIIERPFLVHSSTPQGHTGIFLTTLMAYALATNSSEPASEKIHRIASYVQTINTEKEGLIDNVEQYKLIYRIVDHLLADLKR